MNEPEPADRSGDDLPGARSHPQVTLRPAHAGDAAAVARIADDQLGAGYLPDDFVRTVCADAAAVCFVAVANGQVAGFVAGYLHSAADAAAMTKAPLPSGLRSAERLGVLKTVAVAGTFHGNGLGSQLARRCVDAFAGLGADGAYSVAWRSSAGVNIAGVLQRHGFVVSAEVPNYWLEDSLEQGFSCPDCGEPPCLCSAVIYTKTLI